MPIHSKQPYGSRVWKTKIISECKTWENYIYSKSYLSRQHAAMPSEYKWCPVFCKTACPVWFVYDTEYEVWASSLSQLFYCDRETCWNTCWQPTQWLLLSPKSNLVLWLSVSCRPSPVHCLILWRVKHCWSWCNGLGQQLQNNIEVDYK